MLGMALAAYAKLQVLPFKADVMAQTLDRIRDQLPLLNPYQLTNLIGALSKLRLGDAVFWKGEQPNVITALRAMCSFLVTPVCITAVMSSNIAFPQQSMLCSYLHERSP